MAKKKKSKVQRTAATYGVTAGTLERLSLSRKLKDTKVKFKVASSQYKEGE